MEEETVILKGRVEKTDIKYVWVSGGGCSACEDLDGEEFDSADDIPDRPHPNCQCYVDVIEVEGDDEDGEGHGGGDEKGKGDEPCEECQELFYEEVEELEEMLGDAGSLIDEIEAAIDEFLDFLNKNFIEPVIDAVNTAVDALEQIIGTVEDFIRNYEDMKEANTIDADKYFHAKANCEGAQRGEIGEAVAQGLSDLREFTDHYRNVYEKGMSEAESAKDSAEDQEANEYGREQGQNNPYEDCGDSVEKYRPPSLPEEY